MDNQIVFLCLKDLMLITGSLKNIVSKSFGPNGGNILMMSNTGQMAVTHDGASILSALHLSHPVAKLIVDSVKSFSRTHGDGCKTAIIYVHELLSAIDRSYASLDCKSSDDLAYRNIVLKSLYEFTNSDLLGICNEVQEFVNAQNGKETQNYTTNIDALHNIILTCFSDLPVKVGSHLARIVAILIQAAESGHKIHTILHFLDILLVMLPNQPYTNSCINDNLFLLGNFFGQKSSAFGDKIIHMQCPLEGFVDKESTDAVSVTCASRESFLIYRPQVARHFLSCVKKFGVSLILTTHAVPGYVVQICNELGVNVLACLDSKDLEVVTYITGQLPISSVYESFSEEKNIINVESWEYNLIGGKHYVKIDFAKGYTRYRPKCMFLCAPTEGLCQQLKLLVKKSITVVGNCFSRPLGPSVRDTVYSNKLAECSDLITVNTSTNTTQSTMLSSIQTTNMELNGNGLQFNFEQYLQSNIISGGGYFEHVLTHVLHRYNHNNNLSDKQFCCKIIMKMLEAVPLTLFENCHPFQSHHRHNFLAEQKEAIELVNSEAKTQTRCTHLQNGVVDVLSIKFDVLFAAINLVVKLLRIDAVVGVKRLVKDDVRGSQVEHSDDVL